MDEQRKEALDAAVEQISRRFGKGAVMKLGDNEHMQVATFPTGSLALDKALGVGGIPRGRIIELYGPESGGKCLTEDNHVLTATGYRTVGEIFAENGIEASSAEGTAEVSYPLVNMDGEIENTTHFTCNGRKPTLVIRTGEGTEIRCTKNHPLMVEGSDGSTAWKEAGDIREGDVLAGQIGEGRFGSRAVPCAYALGLLAARGTLEEGRIGLEGGADALFLEQMRAEGAPFVAGGTGGFHADSEPFAREFYERYGIRPGKAADRLVPEAIRDADRGSQLDFLQGYFGGRAEASSESRGLLHGVRLMLSNLGMRSALGREPGEGGPEGRRWTLRVTGSGYDALRGTCETVVSCEDGGTLPTFDFAMERTHSFICEGIISHNTTLALGVVASCQRQGGTAAFIDAEHALDPKYADSVGVDVGALYVSQPDSGEQGLEIAEMMVRSGAVDLIVVDSVAALTPQAEIDGDMGDAHVGLLPRLMSQACRKLTAACAQAGCTIIFINQVREKVGVVFGNPEVTTGGRALKFYSSVRLEVRRTETVKSGGENVGNRIRIKVAKNKVAPPFTEALTEIRFGKGIDLVGESIDLGLSLGLVEKSGSWMSIPGVTKQQGREGLHAWLEENPDAFGRLYEEERAALFPDGGK